MNKIGGFSFSRTLGLAAIALICFSFSSCGPKQEEAHIGFLLWDSDIAAAHVVAAILQDELECKVRLSPVSDRQMWNRVSKGDFDAILSAWLPETHKVFWRENSNLVIDLGPNLEGARIGLAVPSYVNINSIEELNNVRNNFGRRIVGVEEDSRIMQLSRLAMEEYQLNYTLESRSDTAMTGALARAYENEEWIVVTGWTPHGKFNRFDLKFLEDPRGIFGAEESVHTIVKPNFSKKSPNAHKLLDNFYWSIEDANSVMLMIEDGMEPLDAAREWISQNRDKTRAWLR